MYKDFKKSETLDTGFVGGSGILWMFSGIVLGLLVGLGMYFVSNEKTPAISVVDSLQKQIEQVQSSKPLSSSSTQSAVKLENKEQPKKVREHKFSYYAVLPTLDVPVGSEKPINTAPNATANEQNTVSSNQQVIEKEQVAKIKEDRVIEDNSKQIGDYLLQVASFKKESMADKTRGRLSNRGIDAYIQKKKIKGRFWYRVVAGPVDQASVDDWKTTAEKLGHRPLVISVR